MVIAAILIILAFLILIQTVLFPLNFAFAALVAFYLYAKSDFSYWYLVFAAVVLGLLANLNLGLVLFALTSAFFIIHLSAKFLPDNHISKISLIVFSLVLSEVCLVFFKGISQ